MRVIRAVCLLGFMALLMALVQFTPPTGSWTSTTGRFTWRLALIPGGEARAILQRDSDIVQHFKGYWRASADTLCWYSPGNEQCEPYRVTPDSLIIGARHYARVAQY